MTFAEAERIRDCKHEGQAVLTRRQNANGVWVAVKQCRVCGSNCGGVKKGPNFWGLPLWDDARAGQRQQAYEVVWRHQREQYDRDREEESADFWRRHAAALASEHWRRLRDKVARRCGGVCEGCGDRPARHLHHLTYERLGSELLLDVAYVCVQCHELIHGRQLGERPIATIKGVRR